MNRFVDSFLFKLHPLKHVVASVRAVARKHPKSVQIVIYLLNCYALRQQVAAEANAAMLALQPSPGGVALVPLPMLEALRRELRAEAEATRLAALQVWSFYVRLYRCFFMCDSHAPRGCHFLLSAVLIEDLTVNIIT